jgi:hypothetical protein
VPCELLLLLEPLLLLALLPQPAATIDATASPRVIFMGRDEMRAQVVIIGIPPRSSGPVWVLAES